MSSFSEEAHSCSAVPNGQFSGTTASCQLSLSTDHSPIHPLNYFVHVREKWSKMIKHVYTAYKMRIIHVQYSLILTHELTCLYRYLMNAYFSVYILLDCKSVYTYGVYIYIYILYILYILYIHILYIYIYLWWCLANVMEPVFFHSAPPSLPRRTSAGCPGETARGFSPRTMGPWGLRQLNQPRINWVKGNEHDVVKQKEFHEFEQGLYHLFMVYYCEKTTKKS